MALQPFTFAESAALAAGHTVRVTYRDGFTHRLRLETPWPPMPAIMMRFELVDLLRRPVDVYEGATVAEALKLVQSEARKHGRFEVTATD
jgi:hypothetical protein